MRKVDLTMSENYKYKMIKNLVDDNGNKKTAALKLNCSIRTINRLIISYKTYGKCAFIHGNHGRKPSTTIDSQIKEEVISLYKNSFLDTNFTHFCEILERIYSISISDTILNRWLREELIVSPKAHRATKKKMKNKIKNLTKLTQSKKDKQLLIEATENILSSDPHPRRPRFSHFGEQIQMDASSFIWFGDTPTHLHLAIDDATGSVVGAYLDTQETLNAYYHVLYQILIDYGIPYSFYTDRRTVFEYKKINAPSDEDDSFTQFGYACKNLGIIVNTTSVAQAKGRVERLNQTFQSRLPVELRIHNISTIEDANLFLNSYIKEYNQQFALPIHPTKNVFESQPTKEIINQTLSVNSLRKIDSGCCIKFKKKYYIPHTNKSIPMHFKKGTEVFVIESFDGGLYATVLENVYVLLEVVERLDQSKEFDIIKAVVPKKYHIPPMSHPWKAASYLRYLNTQKHRQDGAHV